MFTCGDKGKLIGVVVKLL